MKEGAEMFSHRRTTRRQLWSAFAVLAFGVIVPLLAAPSAAQTITVGSVCGVPGTSVWFDVSFDPQDMSIAGTQNDIAFDSVNTPITTCTVNPDLGKNLSRSFLPSGCSGTGCTSLRGLVFSTVSTGPIPSPIVLYTCRVDIPAGASLGTYALTIGNVSGGSPLGHFMPITGVSGNLYVLANCSC
jgi:hypothetical protein